MNLTKEQEANKRLIDEIKLWETSQLERGLEELIAEMGAAMLLAECGIFEETFEKNASCQHWINELKADAKLIVKAAGRAQRAVDLILGRQYDQEEHNGELDSPKELPLAA
jgi:antirestriction protein ArdC